MKNLNGCFIILGLLIVGCTKPHTESKKQAKVSEPVQRQMASGQSDAQITKNFNDVILSIKSKNDVLPAVKHIMSVASEKQNLNLTTVQIYSAFASLVPYTEGIVWRMRKIIEDVGVIHLSALDYIRTGYYREYMVGPHIKGLVDFIVEPTIKYSKFSSISNLQNEVSGKLIPAIDAATTQITAMRDSAPENYSFEFDMYLVTGYDSAKGIKFISDSKRYRTVLKPHLGYTLSAMNLTLGGLYYSTSYNLDQLLNYGEAIIRKTAINNALRVRPVAITPKESLKVLEKYSTLLTKRYPDEKMKSNLKLSHNYFIVAAKEQYDTYVNTLESVDMNKAKTYIVDPRIMAIDSDQKEHELKERYELISGTRKMVTSEVSGEQVKFDVTALFEPVDDLKEFFPDYKATSGTKQGGFLREPASKGGGLVKHAVTKKKIYSWDYNYGKPISWPDPTFNGLIPEGTNSNIYGIIRSLKKTGSSIPFMMFLPIP